KREAAAASTNWPALLSLQRVSATPLAKHNLTNLAHRRHQSGGDSSIPLYSITSSARSRRDGGTVMPSALAVLRLIANSYLLGACTGRSAGFSPLRTRST